MREYGLKPWEIDALTLSEISRYLEQSDEQSIQNADSIREHLQAWRALTPRQKLLSRRAGLR